jgi:hypothetical protein
MIPHPGTELLLNKHGNTRDGRQAARDEMRAAILASAEREAARAGRSMRCEQGDHARDWTGPNGRTHRVGCQNDGATCICECHDGSWP